MIDQETIDMQHENASKILSLTGRGLVAISKIALIVFAVIGVEFYQPIHQSIDVYYRLERRVKRMTYYEEDMSKMGVASVLFFRAQEQDGQKFFELCVQGNEEDFATGRRFAVGGAPEDREVSVADAAAEVVVQWIADSLRRTVSFEDMQRIKQSIEES